MTKEITKATIIQEMQDKLELRDFEAARFLFDETVIPVYNIEQHLEEWWNKRVTKSITGTGGFQLIVIPQDEKWHLRRYDVVFMTGAYTVAGVYVVRKYKDNLDDFTYLDLGAAKSVSYHIETDVVLTRGDYIYVNIDGYTSTGDLRVYFDMSLEKIR